MSEVRLGPHRLFTGIVRDITERKEWEQQLDSYQQQLRSLAAEVLLAENRAL